MQTLKSMLFFMLLQLPMLAAAQEREVANAPVETVSMTYVLVFGLIFVGMIAGFFVYLFMNDRKAKAAQK